ncbi:nuclear transport factor 2 family protein [Halocalculus aciditolerans]|uniref:SnoaL-like domain-containing protein n=1 Tax=Halocalculus aciditolerans TaxID=1383812 RepID=A0A830F5H5_9EURY|nr:nuclear transport factor 2 family protein [Halocalculus aciditolerans]GGL64914.1 hypothetical protein GCM10009039_23590 [Halocalculus aciditolerans]
MVNEARLIRDLKHEYCYAIDGGRYAVWSELFTEDGRFVRANGDVYEGHDELYGFAADGFDDLFARSAHVVTNPVIDVANGEATGQWYLLLWGETPDGDVTVTQAKYEDRFERVDGEWRIAEVNVRGGIELSV